MQFTEQQLLEMQHPTSPNYRLSATYSVCLTMENDSSICAAIDARRRIDGTTTPADIRSIFEAESVPKGDRAARVQVDEWARGEVNFVVLAQNFNADVEPSDMSDNVQLALRTITVKGNVATLGVQLDTRDYPKVNKVLEALGGKWSRKAGGHVFADKDPEEAIANYLLTGKLDKPQKFGFFPTPTALARELVEMAGLAPGDTCLEPEAGVGGIALVCADIVGAENVRCYELQEKNCIQLRALGFEVVQADFLSVEPPVDSADLVDAVVMNPPFEAQADLDHVEHALKFLAPGGKFAAIMSIGVTFRNNAKTVRFREFLEQVGATIKVNDKNAFRESGTLAQTVSIAFTNPKDSPVLALPSSAMHQSSPSRPRTAARTPAALLALSQPPQKAVQAAFTF